MGTYTTVHNRIESTYHVVDTKLFVTDCATCGVIFAIPHSLEQRRRADGASWYCPNGHSMVFRKSDIDVERERTAALQRRLDREETHRRAVQDQLDAERRSAAAYRGHLTRMRNRVARGVCPVAGCKRSFSELHAHVSTCHPELLGDLPELTQDGSTS